MPTLSITLPQLSALRLMLRLQKIKALRALIQDAMSVSLPVGRMRMDTTMFFRGPPADAGALSKYLERDTEIQSLDTLLLVMEGRGIGEWQRPGHKPGVPVVINISLQDEQQLLVEKTVNDFYSPLLLIGGTPPEIEQILKPIHNELEGLRMAVKTAPRPRDIALAEGVPGMLVPRAPGRQ